MRMVKLCIITLLVLEILAIVIHFDEIMNYTGSVVNACMPIFIMAAAIIWLLKKIF